MELFEKLKIAFPSYEVGKQKLLIKREETANHVLCLWKGRCYVDYTDEEGEQRVPHIFKPPVILGLIEYLAQNSIFEANIYTLEPSLVSKIPYKDLENFLQENPQLYRDMSKYLGDLSLSLIQYIRTLSIADPFRRLADYFYHYPEDRFVDSKDFIGKNLSIRERSLYRYLQALEEMGAIQRDKHSILLVKENLKKLL